MILRLAHVEIASTDLEVAHAFFNAVLRDYARLGRLLANGRCSSSVR